MTSHYAIPALVLTLALCWSCIGEESSEKTAAVEISQDELVAQAEFVPGVSDSTLTVRIRSNRSWFAHLNDEDNPIDPSDPDAAVPWGYLSVERHSNLTGTADETDVTVTFRRNFSQSDIHGVLNVYSEGRIATSVKITQLGAVYHLGAEAPLSVAQCDGDTLTIAVDCNTAWTARVSSSTADVSIDRTEGFDPGTVKVTFGENFSLSDKSATVTFSAESCPDVNVALSQNKAEPYFAFLGASSRSVIGGEGAVSLTLRTNCAWRAEVLSSELESLQILNPSAESGTSGVQTVSLCFEPNPATDPHDIRKATIRFVVDGMDETFDWTLSQRGCLVISFDDNSRFTPEIPSSWDTVNNLCRPGRVRTDIDTFMFDSGQQLYEIHLAQYMRFITRYLYVLGSGVRPTIALPGVEGLELKGLTLGCRIMSSDTQGFAGQVWSDDFPAAGSVALTSYVNKHTWNGSNTSGLHNIDFDLTETGNPPESGHGCVLRFSQANQFGHDDYCRLYISRIVLKYL